MVVSMCLWGLSWPSSKVLSRYCSVINFSVYRYIIVVLTMLALLPALGISARVKRSGIPVFIISGVLLAAYSYLFFMGLKKGTPGAGGVLVTTMNPLMAYIIGMILQKKLPARNELIGLCLGLVASCVLLKVWDSSRSLLEGGNVYFLLAALTWAVMSKFTQKGAKYGSSMGFSMAQYIVTLLCMLPLMDVGELRAALHITDWVFWTNLFFSSAIVTALATTVYFFTTTKIGAERASSFMFIVPLVAAISSWVFLGEVIHVHTAVGGVLGISAVYVMNRKKRA